MDNSFRERLSFNGDTHPPQQHDTWQRALALLPKPPQAELFQAPSTRAFPSVLEAHTQEGHIEWVLSEDSDSSRLFLLPFYVEHAKTYRIPSFSHLFNALTLDTYDQAWLNYFAKHDCREETRIVLDADEHAEAILWTLACAKRLRFSSHPAPLEIKEPLTLKATLDFSEERNLWRLIPSLITAQGEPFTPEVLDFITEAGLVIHKGALFSLAKGACWVAQYLRSGAWFIQPMHLAEALYRLSHRIQDAEWLSDLTDIVTEQRTPLPVIYLRTKYLEAQSSLSLYLAYRYNTHEVFSQWHAPDEINLPIGFNDEQNPQCLYFRDVVYEHHIEASLKTQGDLTFIARTRAFKADMNTLWPLIHYWLEQGFELWAEKHKIEQLPNLGIRAQSSLGWFKLEPFDIQSRQVIDPVQLIKYLKRKALFIKLGNGKLAVLPERWINHLTRLHEIRSSKMDEALSFSAIYAQEVDALLDDEPHFEPNEAFQQILNRLRSLKAITPLSQPEGFRAILKPYQIEGLTWLNLLCDLHIGGILADDMGLGKTVQVLALLQHRLINNPSKTPQTVLVVCPKSVQGHWMHQAKTFIPRLLCHMLQTRDLISGITPSNQHQLYLTSYGLIRHHIETLTNVAFDYVILDEAQMIKNEASLATKAIKQLNATHRLALTGTPIENRFDELVCLFDFLNPYAHLSLGARTPTAEAIRELVEKTLHPFILRRLKEDVLPHLPPKHIEDVHLPMAPSQHRFYFELLEAYQHEINALQHDHPLPTHEDRLFFLEGLLRLRQAATDPQPLLEQTQKQCSSNKRNYLAQQLPLLLNQGHRIVVFSQFLGFLKGVSHSLHQLGIRHIYIDGETPFREKEMKAFETDTSCNVLLISLRVGGVGIDLTPANVCILADPWWNEAVEKQAIDRLHRFGQKKPVTVFRLISEQSIEEKMDILKKNKSILADALGKTASDFLNQLRFEDFSALFKGALAETPSSESHD